MTRLNGSDRIKHNMAGGSARMRRLPAGFDGVRTAHPTVYSLYTESIGFLLSQQRPKTFVDIAPAPDMVNLEEAALIIDPINDAAAFDPIRTKARQLELKFMAQ